jgi:hypothetical protein
LNISDLDLPQKVEGDEQSALGRRLSWIKAWRKGLTAAAAIVLTIHSAPPLVPGKWGLVRRYPMSLV